MITAKLRPVIALESAKSYLKCSEICFKDRLNSRKRNNNCISAISNSPKLYFTRCQLRKPVQKQFVSSPLRLSRSVCFREVTGEQDPRINSGGGAQKAQPAAKLSQQSAPRRSFHATQTTQKNLDHRSLQTITIANAANSKSTVNFELFFSKIKCYRFAKLFFEHKTRLTWPQRVHARFLYAK